MKNVFVMIPASAGPVWFLAGVAVFALGLLTLFGCIVYASRATSFEITPGSLRIKSGFSRREIPLDALILEEAAAVDLRARPDLTPTLRTNGAGLPGYLSGWFRLKDGRKALLHVTDRRRVLYVPTRAGYVLLLSTAEGAEFLAALKRAAG